MENPFHRFFARVEFLAAKAITFFQLQQRQHRRRRQKNDVRLKTERKISYHPLAGEIYFILKRFIACFIAYFLHHLLFFCNIV